MSGCYCDTKGIGVPGVSCGDCPTRDYHRQLKTKMGRPPKPPEQIAVQVSIRLTPARKEKFKALGGQTWLNKKIDKAKL